MKRVVSAFSSLSVEERLGHRWPDVNGTYHSVYVRLQSLIVDYPEAAAATLTLQNQTCPVCMCVSRATPETAARSALPTRRDAVRFESPAERVGRPPAGPIPARGPSAVGVRSRICRYPSSRPPDAPYYYHCYYDDYLVLALLLTVRVLT